MLLFTVRADRGGGEDNEYKRLCEEIIPDILPYIDKYNVKLAFSNVGGILFRCEIAQFLASIDQRSEGYFLVENGIIAQSEMAGALVSVEEKIAALNKIMDAVASPEHRNENSDQNMIPITTDKVYSSNEFTPLSKTLSFIMLPLSILLAALSFYFGEYAAGIFVIPAALYFLGFTIRAMRGLAPDAEQTPYFIFLVFFLAGLSIGYVEDSSTYITWFGRDQLLQRVNSEDSHVRLTAIKQVQDIAKIATKKNDLRFVSALKKLAQDQNQNIRSEAIKALGMSDDMTTINTIIEATNDTSSSVRKSAAWSLGRMEVNSARERLTMLALYDGSVEVQEMAQWALDELPNKVDKADGYNMAKGPKMAESLTGIPNIPEDLEVARKDINSNKTSETALSDTFPNWFFNSAISWVAAIFSFPVFFVIGFSFAYVFSLINKVVDIGLFQPITYVAGTVGPFVCFGYLIADYYTLDMLGHIWAAIVSIPLIIGAAVIVVTR